MLTAATLQLNMKPHRASLCFHIDQTTSTNPCKTQETHFLSKNKLILSEDKTLKWSYLVNFSCEICQSIVTTQKASIYLISLWTPLTSSSFISSQCANNVLSSGSYLNCFIFRKIKKIQIIIFNNAGLLACCCYAQLNLIYLITIKNCENLFSRSTITEYNPKVTEVFLLAININSNIAPSALIS